jgi:preprotein translocase subunit SecG
MYTFLIVIIVIAAILLGLAVLMQNSKGGGLSSTFSSSSQIMGVRRTADFLEKATWGLAITIVLLSFLSTLFAHSDGTSQNEPQQKSKASQAQSTEPMAAHSTAPASENFPEE